MKKKTSLKTILKAVEESETIDELSRAVMAITSDYDDACYWPLMEGVFRLAHKKLARLKLGDRRFGPSTGSV